MLFNSFAFLGVFLPVVVVAYWTVRSHFGTQAGQGVLLLSSLFFYAYARPSYLPLLLGSIVFNWAIGLWIGTVAGDTDEGEAKRNRIMWLGIAVNVAFLCSFKYVNFFFRHLSFMGAHGLLLPNWAAPLGISFFTFTQLMYLVDTSQGLNEPNSLFDHATLVSMFPYVAAGPLVRSSSIVPQFRRTNVGPVNWELGCRGFFLFTLGLAKKVILADAFGHIADIGFNAPAAEYSTLEAWIFAVFYAFQIYYDFSGYSDMAVGSAWMLGIDIPQNFNRPYVSKSMSEFWTRWHISLSNFITNYLYTPILRGLGKATLSTSVFAVIAAMFIAGLWHGAAWTYIISGTLHGIALGVNQIWKRKKAAHAELAGLAAHVRLCGVHAGLLPFLERARGAAHAACHVAAAQSAGRQRVQVRDAGLGPGQGAAGNGWNRAGVLLQHVAGAGGEAALHPPDRPGDRDADAVEPAVHEFGRGKGVHLLCVLRRER